MKFLKSEIRGRRRGGISGRVDPHHTTGPSQQRHQSGRPDGAVARFQDQRLSPEAGHRQAQQEGRSESRRCLKNQFDGPIF